MLLDARRAMEEDVRTQIAEVRRALAASTAAAASPSAASPSSSSSASSSSAGYRSFRSQEASDAISLRAHSREAQLPRGPGYETDDEGKGGSADKGGASKGSGADILMGNMEALAKAVVGGPAGGAGAKKGAAGTGASSGGQPSAKGKGGGGDKKGGAAASAAAAAAAAATAAAPAAGAASPAAR
jgi:hypothetical protein